MDAYELSSSQTPCSEEFDPLALWRRTMKLPRVTTPVLVGYFQKLSPLGCQSLPDRQHK